MPGERDRDRPGGLRRSGDPGLERGVQQRRMETVPCGVGPIRLVQGHLGEHLLAAPPERAQPAEGGTVLDAEAGEAGVAPVEVDRLGAGRRPGDQVRRPGRLLGGHRTGGVADPGSVLGRGRAGGQLHRAAAGSVRNADGQPDPDAALRGALPAGELQRGVQGQFVDLRAARPGARPADQLDDRGAGKQHPPVHGVVGEPGQLAGRQPSGEQQTSVVGEFHHGPEPVSYTHL